MSGELSLEEINKVLGHDVKHASEAQLVRTLLHVPFSVGSNRVPAVKIPSRDIWDREKFNAVGSLANTPDSDKQQFHLPVIDVDGGARAQTFRYGSKAILIAAYSGKYVPKSMLRDVLGDNGIELEVFDHPTFQYNDLDPVSTYRNQQIGAIILRSTENDAFFAVGSTTKNHSHLYVEQAFSAEDHKVLLQELGKIGIISPDWQAMVEQEGMGIVRTPWTKKDVKEMDS